MVGYNHWPLSAEEVTETCEMLLDSAVRHHCPYWLLDGRSHVGQQPRELHDWMREEYFPRVRESLGVQPQVAFLVKPEVWAGLPTRGYEDPNDWLAHAVRMAWFTDEAQARQWLEQQRSRA